MIEQKTNRDVEKTGFEYKNYFKYFSDSKNVIDGLFKYKRIRFTQPWALNDPLEFNPCIKFNIPGSQYQSYTMYGVPLPSLEQFYRINLIESQFNEYGILSLTKVPDCFDMWSRYANGHRGFLVAFKSDFNLQTCMKSKGNEEYPINEVTYVDDFDINVDELINEEGKILKEDVRKELFFKKTSRWDYEEEYRIVRPLKDCDYYEPPIKKTSYRDSSVYLFDFSLDCIESIVYGAHMSNENKKLIDLCCKKYKIDFSQALVVKDEKDRFGKIGKVIFHPLGDSPIGGKINDLSPAGFSVDRLEEMRTFKNIEELNELPYYKNNEQYCKDLYAIKEKNINN